ncbi:hypothetical protein [Ferdinandcohnia sp. Marseille-Q9671]
MKTFNLKSACISSLISGIIAVLIVIFIENNVVRAILIGVTIFVISYAANKLVTSRNTDS